MDAGGWVMDAGGWVTEPGVSMKTYVLKESHPTAFPNPFKAIPERLQYDPTSSQYNPKTSPR